MSSISKIFLALVVSIVLFSGVYAQQNGNVTGKINVSNIAPNVTLEILDSNGNPTTELYPTNTYTVKLTFTDLNSLKDLDKLVVVFESNSSQTNTPDSSKYIYFVYNFSTKTLEAYLGDNSTWNVVVSKEDYIYSYGHSTGSIEFNVTVGKVAMEGPWTVKAYVYDNEGLSGEDSKNIIMEWYGEISPNVKELIWNDMKPDTNESSDKNLSVTAISNGNYTLQIKTDENWTNQYGEIISAVNSIDDLGPQTFYLEIAGKPITYNIYNTWISENGPTSEFGEIFSSPVMLYLGGAPIRGTYTGEIYVMISPQ
ncbi:hypothetical protein ACPB8Q_00145 [Methanocaldococcus indicus]|uniref:hypothetical protein n=1 Tax=Methanocaldococcus indicus TaxID=213231 RepID=UPI003C6D036B